MVNTVAPCDGDSFSKVVAPASEFQFQRFFDTLYASLGTPVQQLFQNFNELIPFLSVHRCEKSSQGVLLPAPCGHVLRERKAQELGVISGSYYPGLGFVNFQEQLLLNVLLYAVQYALCRLFAVAHDDHVIGVPHEPDAPAVKQGVKLIEQNVGKNRTDAPALRSTDCCLFADNTVLADWSAQEPVSERYYPPVLYPELAESTDTQSIAEISFTAA